MESSTGRTSLIAGAVILLATALSPAGVSGAAPSAGPTVAAEPPSVPGELLVGYQRGVSDAQRAEARSQAKAQRVATVADEGPGRATVELVRVSGTDRSEARRRFTSNPDVAYAEPNWIYTHDATSDDPYYENGSLWGMRGGYGSQADAAWSADKTGSDTVYVGVIDEGFQHSHPDLTANAVGNPFELPANGLDDDGNGKVDDRYGWDFVSNDNTVYDGTTDDHGTHVAGTIGAEGGNGVGVAGVAWNVQLLSAKFLGPQGGTTANAIQAVNYFTDLKQRGVNVVATNNSWSGGGYSSGLYTAIANANAQNIMFVAAAGNAGVNTDTNLTYPAGYNLPNVISVAAIDRYGAKASWSNYGATSVDLGAPGVDIWSTLPGVPGAYGSYNGTSMAAPHVTGALALYAASNPQAPGPPSSIRSTLLSRVVATPALSGKTVTGGRLDVNSFVTGVAPVPPPAILSVTLTKGTKRFGTTPVTVKWSGFTGAKVDLYRNGTKIATRTTTDGQYTHSVSGSGTKVYRVCEAGTSTCAEGSITL